MTLEIIKLGLPLRSVEGVTLWDQNRGEYIRDTNYRMLYGLILQAQFRTMEINSVNTLGKRILKRVLNRGL